MSEIDDDLIDELEAENAELRALLGKTIPELLDLRYTDMEGRTLEHLPVPVEAPLAPGEVRYFHRVRGSPRGASEQGYFLHELDRVLEKLRIHGGAVVAYGEQACSRADLGSSVNDQVTFRRPHWSPRLAVNDARR